MTTLTTTFDLLRAHGACTDGYHKLAKALGGVTRYGNDTPIPLWRIAETNDLDDALWCLQATTQDYDTIVRPWLRRYMADVLEHLCLTLLDNASITLLREGVTLLRDPNTTNAQLEEYEARAAWAAWAAGAVEAARAARAAVEAARAARAAARAARAAAWAAWAAGAVETQWQTERFIELLKERDA